MSTDLCPLCGKELHLAEKPELPGATLATLARHFSEDCEATARIVVQEKPPRRKDAAHHDGPHGPPN